MESYPSLPNNVKYLVPSETLINPSILSNLIRKDLEQIHFCVKYYKLKYFDMISHLLKYDQDQNLHF